MTTPFLTRLLAIAGIAGLVVITLASPGATRMWGWPWSAALAVALFAPVALLALRTSNSPRTFVLPSAGWTLLAAGSALVIIASALISVHRPVSVRWSAPLLAAVILFFVVFDWLHHDPDGVARRRTLDRFVLLLLGLTGATGFVLWLIHLSARPVSDLLAARNPFPLGHPNYTAGLALLLLPFAAAVAFRESGRARRLAGALVLLALILLFTSGSRAGSIGLVVLTLAAVLSGPLERKRRRQLALGLILAGMVFIVAHPRTRTIFAGTSADSLLAVSNVQRGAMLTAGTLMGLEQPVLGWGPGTTPLVFPRFRGHLTGGVENVLQLHSAPVHIWAELGAAGLLCLGAFALMALRGAGRDRLAAAALLAYGVFSLTDWQLDVPIFGAAVAVLAARLARPGDAPAPPNRARALGLAAITLAAIVVLIGRRDPAPELNARALALARDPARAADAIALLRQSLALNEDQEIAHFNLGWLLLVREPPAAERHFRAAARLVPDKGGVYFGLGLARLNQGRPAEAARAFALECLNDPAFLTSPWWREPAIAATVADTAAAFQGMLGQSAGWLTADTWRQQQLKRLHDRVATLGQPPAGLERVYQRERTGYPVLMRTPDLAPPVDLYDVRELVSPPAEVPPKGWLPSPLLLALLDESVVRGGVDTTKP